MARRHRAAQDYRHRLAVDALPLEMGAEYDLPGKVATAIYVSLYQSPGWFTHYRLPRRIGFVRRPAAVVETGETAAALPTGESLLSNLESQPDFIVEIGTSGDDSRLTERTLALTRATAFAAGTLVIWDVDLLRDEVVRVYRADDAATVTIYRRGEWAEAEPAVPGWRLPVDALFV